MNIGMIVTGAILATVCVLPFVAVGISKKRSKKEIEKLLRDLVEQNQGRSSKEEFLGKMAIALDESKHLFFFVKKHKDRNETKVVRLAEMKSYKLVKESRTVKGDGGSYALLEALGLQFQPIKKGASEVSVPIFKIDEDLQLSEELELAERWSAIIDEQLRLNVQIHSKKEIQPPSASAKQQPTLILS